jgi:hypothetical protein
MGTKGLPGFEVIEERIVPDKETAFNYMQDWQAEQIASME